MFSAQGPVSRKSRELFGPETPFVKLRPAYSVKLVFQYVVMGIKIKITAKFRASRRHRFEDTKRIMSPEIHPKSFGTFEKQAPGLVGLKDEEGTLGYLPSKVLHTSRNTAHSKTCKFWHIPSEKALSGEMETCSLLVNSG